MLERRRASWAIAFSRPLEERFVLDGDDAVQPSRHESAVSFDGMEASG
jgi:hypothetical protein